MFQTINDTIKKMEEISEQMMFLSNNPSVYNSDFGYYLAIMSRDLRQDAQEARMRLELSGGVL